MQEKIIRKLETELKRGIETEPQVVYLMTYVRKLLELQKTIQRYEYLTFHCDWIVHVALDRKMAQQVLKQFDEANVHLKAGLELEDLPRDLEKGILAISGMKLFKKDISEFLTENGLPGLDATRVDGWVHFLHLYGKVVENCPLIMTTKNAASTIKSVTLHLELANKPVEGDMLYKITWRILDKNGLVGDISVMNSFSLAPRQPVQP